jgi:hypothetical protein
MDQGKLFQVETEYLSAFRVNGPPRRNQPIRRVERYWLCDDCSSVLTLTFEKGCGVVTVPIPHAQQTPQNLPHLRKLDFEMSNRKLAGPVQ